MKYEVKIQEQVSIWRDLIVTIDTEDTKEQVMKNLEECKFKNVYSFEDECVDDTFYETEEVISYDYDNTTLDNIEEV